MAPPDRKVPLVPLALMELTVRRVPKVLLDWMELLEPKVPSALLVLTESTAPLVLKVPRARLAWTVRMVLPDRKVPSAPPVRTELSVRWALKALKDLPD